jgi:hypothetical protein
LSYAGKSLAEIAGYDPWQWRDVLTRARDEQGRLVRGEKLPPWVHVDSEGMRVIKKPVAFETVYKDLRTKLGGMTAEEAEEDWQKWRAVNPKFGVGGDDDVPPPDYDGNPVFGP